MTYSNLTNGSRGEEVKKLQEELTKAGYDVGSTGADGVYGANTQAAVRKYQADHGLTADGIAGQNTQTSLYGSSDNGAAAPTQTADQPAAAGYDAAADAAYQQAISALTAAGKTSPTGTDSYDGQLKALYDQIVNRDKFSYDINSDKLYQQYAEQYANNGRLAMEDTIGQAAALTGGYDSTYAQSVGQQQYNAYMQKLNEVIPELYGQAYQEYQDEGDRLLQQYSLLADRLDTDREYELALDKWNYTKEQDAAAAAAAETASSGSTGGYTGGGNGYDNGGHTPEEIAAMQLYYGLDNDGKWGPNSKAAAGDVDTAWANYQAALGSEGDKKLGWFDFDGTAHTDFTRANGGSLYSDTLSTLKTMKDQGKPLSEAYEMLQELVGNSFISQSEYLTLYNKYRNNTL